MLSTKLDWLTLTIKPEHGSPESSVSDYESIVKTLSVSLMLEYFMDRCNEGGKRGNYSKVLSYEGIQLMLPAPEKYYHQGVCISISSHGLEYFAGYLMECGCSLRDWLGQFRALSFNGYKTKVTRFDYAFDDICGGEEEPKLTMKRVLSSMEDGECCMKNRVWSDEGSDFDRFRKVYRRTKGKFKGLTVALGNRESESYCRFYDKLAEQQQSKNGVVPDGCTFWTRFEMELKGSKAMSALNSFLDVPEDDFAGYMRGVALDHVRFVERTSSNVTRCVCKRWWREFLNGATKAFSLPKIAPARSAAARWSKWFKSEIFPSLNTARRYMNDDKKFLAWLDDIELELADKGKKTQRKDLLDNFKDGRNFYEVLSAFQEWEYHSDKTCEDFGEKMKRDVWDYGQIFYKYILLRERGFQYGL